MNRPQVSPEMVNEVIELVGDKIARLSDGAFASPHETIGALWEEFDEVRDAVRRNMESYEVFNELIDVAVVAIFGAASIVALGADTLEPMRKTNI